MEKTVKKYDISNELGPRNRFDALAARAQLIGTKYNDRRLVNDGTILAELIRNIPWTSDRYYLLEAKAMEIEARLKAIQIEWAGAVENDIVRRNYLSYSMVYKPSQECWQLHMGVGRTSHEIPIDEIHREFSKKIYDHFELDTEIQKKTHREASDDTQDFPFWREETTWTDSRGRIVLARMTHSHDNQQDVGFFEDFYFYEQQDVDFALSLWNEIKRKVSERDRMKAEEQRQYEIRKSFLSKFADKIMYCVPTKTRYSTRYTMGSVQIDRRDPYVLMQGKYPWDKTYSLVCVMDQAGNPFLVLQDYDRKFFDFTLDEWTNAGFFTFDEQRSIALKDTMSS